MYLAQLNIARMKGLTGSPIMKEFEDNLIAVNAIADASPGFIWRLQDESGNATGLSPFDDPMMLINMSVWQNFNALQGYIMRTNHVDFLKRRYEWFEKMTTPNHVMWYIEEGHTPTMEEAKSKLDQFSETGDSPAAFSIRNIYKPDQLS